MDFADHPDHAAIRDTVAAITRSFGSSYYSAHAEGRTATDELWAALAKQGFIGINLPERFGGGGAGLAELALVCEETAAQGCPMLLLLVSSAISGEVIARYGSETQQETWLPQLASGEARIVFAITEPDAGATLTSCPPPRSATVGTGSSTEPSTTSRAWMAPEPSWSWRGRGLTPGPAAAFCRCSWCHRTCPA